MIKQQVHAVDAACSFSFEGVAIGSVQLMPGDALNTADSHETSIAGMICMMKSCQLGAAPKVLLPCPLKSVLACQLLKSSRADDALVYWPKIIMGASGLVRACRGRLGARLLCPDLPRIPCLENNGGQNSPINIAIFTSTPERAM